MLILAKAVLAAMIGLITAGVFGWFLIPQLKKLNVRQKISIYVKDMHKQKEGTPTMGGIIFIIPTLITTIVLLLLGKMELTYNLSIIILVMVSYAAIGLIDDILVVKGKVNSKKGNIGLREWQKLALQAVVAILFFFLFLQGGNDPTIWIYSLGIKIHLGWFYLLFIMFLLVGSSNAVNLTDGLDGLAGGLSGIAFGAMGMITLGSSWLEGSQDIGIFCMILVGALIGFLLFNSHPAKVFMGDTGALSLGATLAAVAILTRHELTLAVVGGVFVIETLSSIIQIISIKKFKKKVFLMAPIHHHFEKLGWEETSIVKLFWLVGLILGMAAIAFGVWI